MKNLALVLFFGTLILSVNTANAAVVYYESFSVNTAVNNNFPINGWNLHGPDGLALTNGGTPNGANNQAVGINDNRTNNIAAGMADAMSDTQTGRTFYVSNGTNSGILWTSEYASVNSGNVTNFRWWDRSDVGGGYTNRAAVQVSGSWYVSSTGAVATGAATINAGDLTWTQIGVDFASAQWLPISFTVGSTLTQTPSGTAQALPAGTITAFGVYHQATTNGLARVDGFEINAVPEPASLTLLGMAGLGLFAVRRSRKLA